MADSLFITGATGFVGRALVARLRSSDPERKIVALVRNPNRAATLFEQGIELIAGDVTLPHLGMDDRIYARLAASTTQIIHAAADVTFGASLAMLRVANVTGTQHTLDFARRCNNLKAFGHLSTISVHGLRPGSLLETHSPSGQAFVNAYQQSKHEAELLVGEAMSDVPAQIFRLSIVAADSIGGHVSQFNYSHHVIRYLPNSILPAIPGDLEARVDLVPMDWTAAALAYMFDNKFTPGAVRNLCAGPECSLALHEAMKTLRAVMAKYTATPLRFPQLVTVSEFDHLIATCGDIRLKKAAAILGPHIRLLGMRQQFLNDLTKADLETSGIKVPPLREWFANMIDYCMQTDWGREQGRWSMIENAMNKDIERQPDPASSETSTSLT